ncbi:MAG: hypothetical protein IJH50_07645 [Kiritimatiellae bacterium]|nr:hypothetical protein [Kiritimatiellia bacterium]
MKRTVILIMAALAACSAAVADGVLTIDAPTEDIIFTDNVALARASKVVKTGAYKATINYSNDALSSFAGEIEVQEGTLAAQYLRNFGTPTKITVSSGATLDLTSENTNPGNIASTPIFIAGTGVNGGGAIRRTGGGAINSLLGNLTLTADASICNSVQIGCPDRSASVCNLEGHTLTINAGISGSNSVFYWPRGSFKKNDSTADPGHIIVEGGTFYPRYNAMSGGSTNNTLTLKDCLASKGYAKPILRLRNTDTHIQWKLIVDGDSSAYIEDDESGSSDIQNVWAGPVELRKQLTATPKQNGSHLTLAGNVTGRNTIANAQFANNGLLTLKGTNELLKITSRSGRTVFDGGKTTASGAIDATAGSITFKDTEVAWDSPTGLYAAGEKSWPVDVAFENTFASCETNAEGGASCRFYLGSDTSSNPSKYGRLTVCGGSVVSNISMAVGHSGFGALIIAGANCSYPIYNSSFDSLGYNSGTYGYVSVSDGKLKVDGSKIADNTIWSFWGYQGTVALAVRAGGEVEFVGTPSQSATHVEFGAITGGRFSACLSDGAKMEVLQTLDFGRNAVRNHAGAADVTLMGTGTVLHVGKYMRVFWTNAGGDFTLNINDGATLASPNLYRLDGGAGCQMKVNLNGGIIRKLSTSSWFSNGSDWNDTARQPTRVTVYERGFTIDTSSMSADVNMEYAFQAPGAGKRIKSIALPMANADYASDVFMGPPTVRIAGSGEGATAFVDYDDVGHTNRGVIVTCPGWGYGNDTVVTIESGNRQSTYICSVELEDQPETGWTGFRKVGAARLNMHGANTYRGDTEVVEGILSFLNTQTAQCGMPQGGGIILHKGAMISFNTASVAVTVPFIRGCGTTSFGYYTVTNAVECFATDLLAGDHLTVNQRMTLGESTVVKVLGAAALAASGETKFTVAEVKNGLFYSSLNPRLVFVDNGVETEPQEWHAAVKGNTLQLRKRIGATLVIR